MLYLYYFFTQLNPISHSHSLIQLSMLEPVPMSLVLLKATLLPIIVHTTQFNTRLVKLYLTYAFLMTRIPMECFILSQVQAAKTLDLTPAT